jgi:hypothetical protein
VDFILVKEVCKARRILRWTVSRSTHHADDLEMNGAAAQAAADIEAMLPAVEPEEEDQFDDAEEED